MDDIGHALQFGMNSGVKDLFDVKTKFRDQLKLLDNYS